MHSLAAKIISLTGLFVITFISGLLPLKLRKRDQDTDAVDVVARRDLRRKKFISLSTCFAGGAFFASSMLELIPVVRKDFNAVFHHANTTTGFPIAEFAVSIGFFFILTLEQIVHVYSENSSHGHSHGTADNAPHFEDNAGYSSSHNSGDSGTDDDHDDAQKGHNVLGTSLGINSSNGETDMFADVKKKHHKKHHYLRSFFLLIALIIHSLFEGLAIGLFQNIDDMVEVLGALIIHKCILGFSIGINQVQHGFPAKTVVCSSFLFSAMSPLGVGIGVLMVTYASSHLSHIFCAVFQAMATGTFLYVTFFEIFFHEVTTKESNKLLKILMILFGYGLVAIVVYFESRTN